MITRMLCLGSVAGILLWACGSEETEATPAAAGTGAASVTTVGSGGTGTGGEEPPPCPHEGPDIIDPSTLEVCPMCAGGARCIPSNLIPPEFADNLGDCDAMSKCVPDDFIKTEGNFIPATCTSIAGNEGRCLSECLPDVAAQAALLPQDTCPEFQRCVPCFDPISGEETGACALSCDPGPMSEPMPLPSCCDGLGTCVPSALVPPDQVDSLPQDTCPMDANDYLCAPTAFIADPNYVAPSCTVEIPILGEQDGACVPKCFATGVIEDLILEQKTCAANHVCAPCNDPFSGDPTGICPPP